jgi:hypothetical protein
MAPFFTLFCNRQATKEQTECVRTLEKYYSVFIDSEIDPVTIKSKYGTSKHKFFGKDLGEWLMYDYESVDCIPPACVLTFDADGKVGRKDWVTAFEFIKTIFSEEPDQSIIDKMYVIVPKAPIAEKISVVPAKDVVKQNNEYMFSHWMDTEKDICICQIDKPFTDRPYTCVIEKFSEVDFVPMFTAFYICSSWGVTPQDSIFLVHLWNHLDMKARYGQINLEQRLKDVVSACEAGAPEPRVYRDNIEGVRNLLFK